MFGTPLYWRITHKQPRFLVFDGRLVLILFFSLMHIRVWTVGLSVIAIAALWFFERKGVSADSILRFLRATLVGRRRTARGLDAERSAVDYGYETEGMVEAMRRQIELMGTRRAARNSSKKGSGKRSAKKEAGHA